MNTTARTLRGVAGVALIVLAACGNGPREVDTGAAAEPVIAELVGTVTLPDLVAACTRTANDTQAGAVVIRGDLRDNDRQVTIGVPCAVQLAGTTGVHLAKSTIDSATINFSDRAFDGGRNEVQLTEVNFVGRAGAGFLLDLSDPEDQISFARSSISYPLGIAIRSNGDRTLPDSGGSVRMSATTLRTTGPGSTVALTASSLKGLVQLANPVIDSPSFFAVAEQCAALIAGKLIDCGSSTLAADLKQQAQAVNQN